MPPAGAPAPRFPYEDPSLPVDQRVDDLLPRLDRADRIGLLFHPHGGICDPAVPYEEGRLPLAQQIRELRISHFALQGTAADARQMAAWHNHLQDLAAEHPLRIPITLSSDPRHSSEQNLLTSEGGGAFSTWPDHPGMAALGDASVTERYADIVRREYRAVGIRVGLHPQIDLATEPRWGRIVGGFSESADLTSRMATAYIRGLQGAALGPGSVAAMTKHFPGGGPQKDGLDPHFPDGREQIYPGGMRDLHLEPFRAAIAAGTAQIMPYYGMPVGTDWEEVAFGFNRQVLTDLLRGELGFTGVVCTDWTILTDISPDFPAKAWGLEHLSAPERALASLRAGADQFGGENCTHLIAELLETGQLTEQELEGSLRRILEQKFRLGLFDENRWVDPEQAGQVVGAREHAEAGHDAQRRSLVLLTNREAPSAGGTSASTGSGADVPSPRSAVPSGTPLLPLRPGLRVYAEGIDARVLAERARVVTDPAEADVIVVRTASADHADPAKGWMGSLHQGSLEYDDAFIDHLQHLTATAPTVIDVHLRRPGVLTPLMGAAALIGSFGTEDRPFLDVLFGEASPQGSLPFDLPRSQAAVEASRSDVPHDTADPLFRFGHGLRY